MLGTHFIWKSTAPFNEIQTAYEGFSYFLNFVNTVRILRILRIHKQLEVIEDAVQRFLGQLILSVITMLLFGK